MYRLPLQQPDVVLGRLDALPSDAITDFLKRVVRSPCRLIRYMAPALPEGEHVPAAGRDAVLQMLKSEKIAQ